MQRLYNQVIKQHFEQFKEMLFLAGPRQVGKTTISLSAQELTADFIYLNWDNQDHRSVILEGPAAVARHIVLNKARLVKPILVFDELHKYKKWKIFLKGFFDTYKDEVLIIVTGSSKLDIYRKTGDSLMGRYFLYRVHPLSVAECLRTEVNTLEISKPALIEPDILKRLFEYGGFPEPYINKNERFARRWQRLRKDLLFKEDIRDLSRIQEIQQLEILSALLEQQVGQLINYSNLANKVRVSVDTIRRWVKVLTDFYFCFPIKPWSKNVTRSILKEPKMYLWDWSNINDIGKRTENFIAGHLLKAIQFWTDQGLGSYDLYFLRDKEKREVDFLVTKNENPWFLVEAKYSDNQRISPSLELFQKQIKAQHAFQVVMDLDYIDFDCFSKNKPIIVPASTFLSQLV